MYSLNENTLHSEQFVPLAATRLHSHYMPRSVTYTLTQTWDTRVHSLKDRPHLFMVAISAVLLSRGRICGDMWRALLPVSSLLSLGHSDYFISIWCARTALPCVFLMLTSSRLLFGLSLYFYICLSLPWLLNLLTFLRMNWKLAWYYLIPIRSYINIFNHRSHKIYSRRGSFNHAEMKKKDSLSVITKDDLKHTLIARMISKLG